MKESYGEDIASHTGLEPCAGVREGSGEASAEVRAGWVLSPEIKDVPGADAVPTDGRPHQAGRYRKTRPGPAGSEAPRMHGTTLRENREIPEPLAVYGTASRDSKA